MIDADEKDDGLSTDDKDAALDEDYKDSMHGVDL